MKPSNFKRRARIHRYKARKRWRAFRKRWDVRKVAAVAIAAFLFLGVSLLVLLGKQKGGALAASTGLPEQLGAFDRPDVIQRNGFVYNLYEVAEGEIKQDEFLGVILGRFGVGAAVIDRIANEEKEVERRPTLVVGKPYTVLSGRQTGEAEYFIYEPSPYRYYVYDIQNGGVDEIEREVERRVATASGVITSSLWNAIVGSNSIDPRMVFSMASNMEEAFQWTVDFHHVQKGDRFKLIYEEDWVEGQRVGIGKLLAAVFDFDGQEYHAVRYQSDNYDGFFDLEGRPMVKTFLKAPVKYSRISSRYNLRRFHPVLKRRKAHLGTDFAAPTGTPIYATADGTITKKSRSRGNGNYIKIKHDNTYSTQYLHMNGFAKGTFVGKRVKQGEVIGYVGSTGLATGPHVCYRFWKNGKQVDPLRMNFPSAKPMDEQDRKRYLEQKKVWISRLDSIDYALPEAGDTADFTP